MATESRESHNFFWHELGGILGQQPPEVTVVLAGDVNARVGNCRRWIGPASFTHTDACGEAPCLPQPA
eukprot:14055314-Alexandrium_andersonii.AAC.1